VLDHLMQEHRQVEKMLDELSDAKEDERAPLLDQLESALGQHMVVEEQHIYPIVEQVIDGETEEEAETEHGLARDGLAKLRELEDQPGFGAAVDMLTAGIKHHVQEEEEEVFPKLRAEASDQIAALDLEQLGMGTDTRRGSANGSEPTKAELYERAKEVDLEGRSTMSKDELKDALARQS